MKSCALVLLLFPTLAFAKGTGVAPGAKSAGEYEGVLRDPVAGLTYKQSLRLTATGAFSSRLQGLGPAVSFRGIIDPTGTFSGQIGSGDGAQGVEMLLTKSSGLYVISGTFRPAFGPEQTVTLRRVNPAADYFIEGDKVTADISRSGKSAGPRGGIVATGKVGANGKIALLLYGPGSVRGSAVLPTLEGDFLAMGTTLGNAALLGSLKLKDKAFSDIGGSARYASLGSQGSNDSGFDQQRDFVGSKYVDPGLSSLPAAPFKISSNNLILRWIGGDFDGKRKVGTWSTDGRVVIPRDQSDSSAVVFDRTSGLFEVWYRSLRFAGGFPAKGHAVVLQKAGKVRGYYSTTGAGGDLVVVPNTRGANPDFISVTPLSKLVPAARTYYKIRVNAEGKWRVTLPAGLLWVSAKIDSEGATVPWFGGPPAEEQTIPNADPTQPPTIIPAEEPSEVPITEEGEGKGFVTIEVEPNTAIARREIVIRIAGFDHTVKQDFR